MKAHFAYLCNDCDEIFERAPHSRCPTCQGESIAPLDWLRKSAQERAAWLRRIGALQTQEPQPAVDLAQAEEPWGHTLRD
jgi:hypothetical protein